MVDPNKCPCSGVISRMAFRRRAMRFPPSLILVLVLAVNRHSVPKERHPFQPANPIPIIPELLNTPVSTQIPLRRESYCGYMILSSILGASCSSPSFQSVGAGSILSQHHFTSLQQIVSRLLSFQNLEKLPYVQIGIPFTAQWSCCQFEPPAYDVCRLSLPAFRMRGCREMYGPTANALNAVWILRMY